MSHEAYSEIADSQLDALERSDPAAYRDAITVCGLIFDHPGRAQAMSSAISTDLGLVLRLAVPGRPPLKVFWSTNGAGDGPRSEAVLDHP